MGLTDRSLVFLFSKLSCYESYLNCIEFIVAARLALQDPHSLHATSDKFVNVLREEATCILQELGLLEELGKAYIRWSPQSLRSVGVAISQLPSDGTESMDKELRRTSREQQINTHWSIQGEPTNESHPLIYQGPDYTQKQRRTTKDKIRFPEINSTFPTSHMLIVVSDPESEPDSCTVPPSRQDTGSTPHISTQPPNSFTKQPVVRLGISGDLLSSSDTMLIRRSTPEAAEQESHTTPPPTYQTHSNILTLSIGEPGSKTPTTSDRRPTPIVQESQGAFDLAVKTKLSDYFLTDSKSLVTYKDVDCQEISRILRQNGRELWSLSPRIYIILRIIGQLHIFDTLLEQGINDLWLPFTASLLPKHLGTSVHDAFLETQRLVLTKALDLERKDKGHAHFTRDEPFPYEVREKLGEGGFGYVDKVYSSLSGREFARKRFRRGKWIRKEDLRSFKTELEILRQIHHIHCVELVGIPAFGLFSTV